MLHVERFVDIKQSPCLIYISFSVWRNLKQSVLACNNASDLYRDLCSICINNMPSYMLKWIHTMNCYNKKHVLEILPCSEPLKTFLFSYSNVFSFPLSLCPLFKNFIADSWYLSERWFFLSLLSFLAFLYNLFYYFHLSN